MVGDASINSIVSDILNDKDCIKSRQDCWLEVDLLSCVFQIIISTKNGISCSQYWTSWIKNCRDSSLSNWDSLLLHGFMDSHSVLRSHLIKLIDTDNSTICENHSSSLELEFSSWSISEDWGCQSGCTGSLSWSVDRDRSHSFDVFKELGLSSWGISQQKHINITSKSHSIRELFSSTSEQKTCNSFFNIVRSKDSISNWSWDSLVNVFLFSLMLDLFLFFLSQDWHWESSCAVSFRLNSNSLNVRYFDSVGEISFSSDCLSWSSSSVEHIKNSYDGHSRSRLYSVY